ncbi:BfmA/BtgA family mobilization protein [Flagellimonas beolgyonensis]|uniref:BfmA/BtgA family mobilization protein n=1 Tax=Flagellimonas beolgyonensis TaxID=864064 RepID=UPI000F8C535B|nr:BfmA/BtgA family mobilization protein [Allomuricauda beolgyonensis]
MGSTYHNIRVNKINKDNIKRMSKREGKTETDFVNQMISFVHKTGINVYEDASPNFMDALSKHDKRVISFLKKREQDFFVPMQKSFREMIRVHNLTLQSLDILHPGEIAFNEMGNKEDKKEERPTFVIPQTDSPKSLEIKLPNEAEKKLESKVEIDMVSASEKEAFLDRIERAEKEKEAFEKELTYLLKNIVPNKSISGPKFTCNLPQKEIDRIKHLVDGH